MRSRPSRPRSGLCGAHAKTGQDLPRAQTRPYGKLDRKYRWSPPFWKKTFNDFQAMASGRSLSMGLGSMPVTCSPAAFS